MTIVEAVFLLVDIFIFFACLFVLALFLKLYTEVFKENAQRRRNCEKSTTTTTTPPNVVPVIFGPPGGSGDESEQ